MKIDIYRQGVSKVEDPDNFATEIVVEDLDDLQVFLRSYLPKSINGTTVWTIRIEDIDKGCPILCYYYMGTTSSYFMPPKKSCELHDGDTLFCEYYDREKIDIDIGVPIGGSLLYRIQKSLENDGITGTGF